MPQEFKGDDSFFEKINLKIDEELKKTGLNLKGRIREQ